MSEPTEVSPSGVPWRVTEVKYPAVIWERYADALGWNLLLAWYGENWPPHGCRPGEQVFVVRDPGAVARPFDPTDHPSAWISLTQDQFDATNYYMSRGVWPDRHGLGLGRFMRAWVEQWVIAQGGNSVTIWVHAENEEHLDKVMADNSYWELSAIANNPLQFMFVHYME